ncbi:hypothetical protein BJF78_32290 [Pseudonocardia sp. CNS-139]|nr:hypothetical protein BJF78_32290 [Pseudonocardia sp. CNS-139]
MLAAADGTPVALDGATGELVLDPPRTSPPRSGTAPPRSPPAPDGAGAGRGPGRHPRRGARAGRRERRLARGRRRGDRRRPGRAGPHRVPVPRPGRRPGRDEQEAAYRAVADGVGGRRITLRTLDVGGDKPLPYLPQPAEANPFLGVRGIRLAPAYPQLFADQLLAIVRTAHATPVSVMFPMVATLDELHAARAALDAAVAREGRGVPAGLQVGIMVEVPAAALKAAAFVPSVDFFSIGTNDLTQYTLAAERGNPAVAGIADPLDPGVLRLVDAVCRAAGAGPLVAVCGEAAADPVAAELLVGLGVRELSVAPAAVAGTKQAVRELDAAAAARRAGAALAADGPAAVRASPVRQ